MNIHEKFSEYCRGLVNAAVFPYSNRPLNELTTLSISNNILKYAEFNYMPCMIAVSTKNDFITVDFFRAKLIVREINKTTIVIIVVNNFDYLEVSKSRPNQYWISNPEKSNDIPKEFFNVFKEE